MGRLSADHFVMCAGLIVVWLFTVSCCQDYQCCSYIDASYTGRFANVHLLTIRG